MKLGLIGLGNMGHHFGSRFLAAGYSLIVYDNNPEAIKRLAEKGAMVAQSPKDLAAKCQFILLCLPTPSIVQDVVESENGLLQANELKVIIDLSTTGPSMTEKLAASSIRKGVQWIGSPVSGGTTGAQNGTLTLMAAGDEETFNQVREVLSVLGKNIFYLGSSPNLGQTMKIVNNTLCAVSMVAACETLVFGAKSGLDPKTMLDVINVSSGRSFATQEKIPQCILNRDFPMRFSTDLLHKDIKLCMEEAEKLGVPMVVSPAARQFLAFAISQGDGPKDYAHIIKHIEGWSECEFGT